MSLCPGGAIPGYCHYRATAAIVLRIGEIHVTPNPTAGRAAGDEHAPRVALVSSRHLL
jgi:hypothetical protein